MKINELVEYIKAHHLENRFSINGSANGAPYSIGIKMEDNGSWSLYRIDDRRNISYVLYGATEEEVCDRAKKMVDVIEYVAKEAARRKITE